MNQLKIGQRLAIAFGLVLTITVAIAAAAVWKLGSHQESTARMVQQDERQSKLAAQWAQNLRVSWSKVSASLKTGDRP